MLRLLLWGGPKERGDVARLTLGVVGSPDVLPARPVPTGQWSWVVLSLPVPLRPGEVRFTLEASTFIPRAVSAGGDSRELGVGFRQLEVNG